MSVTRRRFLGRAAAALMAAAVLVIASVPFLPGAWTRSVLQYGPTVLLVLIAGAAVLSAVAGGRRGRPAPRRRAVEVGPRPAARRSVACQLPARRLAELPAGTGVRS